MFEFLVGFRSSDSLLSQAAAQFQGIVGPQVYQSKYGPTYKVSFAASIGLLVGAIASISVTWWLVAKADRRRAAEKETQQGEVPGAVKAEKL